MATPGPRQTVVERLHQLAPTPAEAEIMLRILAVYEPDAVADAIAFVEQARAAQPTGYRIPPPPDPAERARWEAGVARRLANGERYVGDGDYRPTTGRPVDTSPVDKP